MARTPGCRCPQCWTLREVFEDQAASTQDHTRQRKLLHIASQLPAAPGHEVRLHVVTGLDAKPECNGRMTCPCDECEQQRAQRIRRRQPAARQPWEPKRLAA